MRSRYPLLGRVVDERYHLIGGLGQGGLGTVYLARHLHLGQLFAVKFLDIDTLSLEADEKQKARFRQDFLNEARVASVIRHPAVVRVNDFGQYEALPYLVMEYVPGPNLLQLVSSRGRLDVPEALNIARRIAEALDAFHERRLVHRDLKPANVVLDPRGNGQLTLVDLGLVKDLSESTGRASTHPLALRGTPGYLAPEQVPAWVLSAAGAKVVNEKQLVDARVDLYALGVILYEMLAGVSPYPDGSNNQIIIWSCTRDPIPLERVEPPVQLLPGLEELIYDTMNRDPAQRPASAAAFLERLDAVASGDIIDTSWPAIESASLSASARALRSVELSPGSGLLDVAGEGRTSADRALLMAPGLSSASTLQPPPITDPLATVDADPDSIDSLLGAPGALGIEDDGEEDEATRIDGLPDSVDLPSAPGPALAAPAPPAKRPLRLALLAIPAALLGVLAVFLLRDDPTPSPGPSPVVTPRTAPATAAPPAVVEIHAAPDATAKVVSINARPDAGAPDAAQPDAAPPKAKAGATPPKAKVSAKPEPKRRVRRTSPAKLLAQADSLLKRRDYRGALKAYQAYTARVGSTPVEVRDRIRFCKKQLR